jgi:hypothetical protein
MSPVEVVQTIPSAGVDVVGLDLKRTVVVLRSVIGRSDVLARSGTASPWDDQSPDREVFKGLSRDRVLRRRVTAPHGSQACDFRHGRTCPY